MSQDILKLVEKTSLKTEVQCRIKQVTYFGRVIAQFVATVANVITFNTNGQAGKGQVELSLGVNQGQCIVQFYLFTAGR